MNFNKKTLILDGETRAALAIVRSLGREGVKVIVGSEYKESIAGSSRFCRQAFQYHSPFNDIQKFIDDLCKIISNEKVDVLFPVTDATTFIVLKNNNVFGNVTIAPCVSFETYWAASNKISLMKTAQRVGIPYPRTIFIDPSCKDTLPDSFPEAISYPLIVKPMASIIDQGNTLRKTSVKYASNKDELIQIITTDNAFTQPYMLQEVIDGDGCGIFVFCINGVIIQSFSHRRIREKPPYGGVSVVCESTEPDPIALKSSEKLLKELNWNGIAMVEFKRDKAKNNIPVLMEINARFWGSLQLAIDAGVNFPFYQYLLSQEKAPPETSIIKPTRSRWLLGDLDHLIIRLKMPKNNPRYPQNLRSKLFAIATFLLEFTKGSKIEEFRYHDLKPFWYAIRKWIKPHHCQE